MKAEPSLSSMKEQELKKTVMPFAQMRMKETNLLGPDVRFAPFFFVKLIISVPGQSLHALTPIHHFDHLPCIIYHIPCLPGQVLHAFTPTNHLACVHIPWVDT